MPNWCSTRIVIRGNQNQISGLNMRLLESISEIKAESGFGKCWEGNVLAHFGIPWEKIRCRGSITSIDSDVNINDENDAKIYIDQEDAWSPNVGYMKKILDKHYPDLSIGFVAVETGCGVYVKWGLADVLVDNVYLSMCIDGEYIDEYFTDKQAAINFAAIKIKESKGVVIHNEQEFNKYEEELNSEDGDDYMYLNLFEESPCDLYDY